MEEPMNDLTSSRRGAALAPARDPLFGMRRDFDRLFDLWAGHDFWPGARALGAAWPSVEVTEDDKQYFVTAELPGIDEKDIDISVRDDALILSGEKRSEIDETKANRRFTERSYGRFERAIPLDVEVEADKAAAEFKAGVLKVTLPKTQNGRGRTKQIPIRTQ
jgi:HSP20 family protein